MRRIKSSRWHKSQINVLRRSLALQMCCSQFAGAELKNFSAHLWLKGSQALALGHLSAHDIKKVSQGWFRPCLCLSGCVLHVFNSNTTRSSKPGCQDPFSALIQTAVVALTHFLYYLIKQQFSAFDEVSGGPEWSPSEGAIPPKAKEPACGITALQLALHNPSVRNYRTLLAASVKIIAPLSDFYPSTPCFKYIH